VRATIWGAVVLCACAVGCSRSRRAHVVATGAGGGAQNGSGDAQAYDDAGRPRGPIRLADYAPRSMLHAEAHDVPRAKFPVIDFHQHVNDKLVTGKDGQPALPFPADKLLALMDAANVRTIVVLTGPTGEELTRLINTLVKPHPGRFIVFAQVDWSRSDEPDFGAKAAARLRDDVARGARGLKVLKDLGLYQRDKTGKLLAIDDPKFDPIWRTAGELGIPVGIHSGDPEAFFLPRDAHNERYEELWMNPDWSFAAPGNPSLKELIEARDRVFARHPRTTFVALHVGGWPENLDYVSELLRKHPNVYVELGAREAELGRQPRRARRLFLEFPDRVLFGTDFLPEASMYANHFRWLETEDEYFPYHGHPEQGRWNIYGLGLPDEVLRKVYSLNAEKVLGPAGLAPVR
jgi:predicted TIM-barrel fold metal-dependent hydrolase